MAGIKQDRAQEPTTGSHVLLHVAVESGCRALPESKRGLLLMLPIPGDNNGFVSRTVQEDYYNS